MSATAAVSDPGALGRRRALGLSLAALGLAVTLAAAWTGYGGWTSSWAGMSFGSPENRSSPARRAIPWGPLSAGPGDLIQIVPDSPADRAGLSLGDRIVAVSGVAIEDSAGLARLARDSAIGATLTYRVARDGAEREVPVTLDAYARHPRATLRLVPFGLLALSFLAIGAFLFWRRPFDLRVALFALVCAASAYTFVLLPYMSFDDTLRGIEPGIGFPPIKTLVFAGAGLFGFIFLSSLWHFALIFPRPRPILLERPWLPRWIHGAPVVLLCYLAGAFLAGSSGPWLRANRLVAVALPLALALLLLWGRPRDLLRRLAQPARAFALAALLGYGAIAGIALNRDALPRAVRGTLASLLFAVPGMLVMAFYLAIPIVVMVVLARAWRDATLEERQQIRWPLWAIGINTIGGLILGLGSLAVSLTLPPSVAHETEWVTSLLQVPLYLCLPIGFAIGILRYRLMDLDLVVRRTTVYAVVTGFMVVAYLGIVGGVGGWIAQTLGIQSTWVTVFGTLGVAALFVPIRNRVQSVIDRRFDRTRYESGASLQRLSLAFAEARDARDHARIVLEELHRTLKTRGALVLAPDEAGRTLVPLAGLGTAVEEIAPLPLRAAAAALAEGGARRELPEPLRAVGHRVQAEVVLPVRRRRELLGVLLVGRRLSEQAYEAADLEYLDGVAGQLAVALANLATPQQARELDEARQIQAALLPRSLPELPGVRMAAHWQPAREVAGDYYDGFTLDGGAAALCVADVAGKGLPAALLMSNLQATVKTFAAASATPAELCARINRVLVGHLQPGRFVTFFYAVLAPDRSLVYTNAGHNPPLLMRADGSCERLEQGGTLLGAFPDAEFEQGVASLRAGDRLVLYTDGVVEARSEAGELFGEERLIEVLRRHAGDDPHGLQRRVLEVVSAFCDDRFEDDATLLLVAVD